MENHFFENEAKIHNMHMKENRHRTDVIQIV